MTYAIFKAAGFQYRAELGDVLRLPSLDVEAGDTVTFDEVLLGATDDDVRIGRPTLDGGAVRAEVVRHGRADKIIVFKFKRRKNYRRKQGHRQDYTEIRVKEIELGDGHRVELEPEKKKTTTKKKTKKKPTTKKKTTGKSSTKAKASDEEKKTKSKSSSKTTKSKTTAKKKKSSSGGSKSKTASKKKKKTD